jgi:hypothetical protein
MAASRKLKVYRTPIGFHDAYVAAASQKAALEAWGTDTNLFARGIAEIVSDPELTAEPLAKPGTVIKRLRGTTAEQLAALGPAKTTRPEARAPKVEKTKAKPVPSRSALEAAEQALAEAATRHAAEEADLAKREAALQRERGALDKAHASERRKLERALADERADYEAALRAWDG